MTKVTVMTTMGRVWLVGLAALCVTACGGVVGAQALQPANHDVVINEIHYDPDVKTEAVEFIELYNNGTAAVDLSGWSLADAVSFTFPAGTSLASHAYLVVAENPTALQTKFKVASLGPWTGRLANEGERIVLCDAAKRAVDQVTYQCGFPWPTVGDSPGYSIELINPSLDNDLGGSWRASVSGGASSAPAVQAIFGLTQVWKYNQAGTDLGTAWRASNYNDAAWPSGPGLLYVEDAASVTPKNTPLTLGKLTYYFRTHFAFSGDPSSTALQFSTMIDDGAVFYLNGTEFYRLGMADGTVNYNTLANRTVGDAASEGPFTVGVTNLVKGDNVLAVEVHQANASSSDIVLGMTLATTDSSASPGGHGPSPGKINSVYSTKSPPAIRQVAANPPQPAAGQVVTITAKVTDPEGVDGVSLSYQVVDPGAYISIDDAAYANAANWTTVAMEDGGTAGDTVAGDGVYSVLLPASLQIHRRLIRYRITAIDAGGQSVTVPYADDPQPNFAYFVYDGVPAWSGAIQPTSTDRTRSAPAVYDFTSMPALPVYHLITTRKAHEDSQHIPNSTASAYSGSAYLWAGTLVYNGVVYDHIHFRARGGVWRYSMGKNMWKFDFNRGHDFQAYDEYGRPFKAAWKKLNLGADIQQGDYGHRGEQGLFEYAGWRLYNLAGLPACMTFPVHFRIVERSSETNDTPTNQYDDDFQGLYLAVEQVDGRFLDQHGLPDGNLYKMEGGGTLNNQGPDQPSNGSDLGSFMSGYSSSPKEAWWRANFDLTGYYAFRAITEAIHNGDIGYGKNYFYYHNPETNLWSILAWDLDLTWAESMFGNGNDPFKALVLFTDRNYSADREPFNMEFRNRLQEVMDLLFNADQTGQMIDEYMGLVDSPAPGPSMVDADRAMWDYNPIMVSSYVNSSKSGQGRFYQIAATKDFRGMGQLMKNYIRFVYDNTRNWMGDPGNGPSLTSLALDPVSPDTPTVTYVGSAGYPLDHLKFRASAFSGSIGVFGAMRWRIAEVSAPGTPAFDSASPRKYEIEAAWDSGEITSYRSDVDIPAGAVEQGKTYRVRCRMRDSTGRWSGWSSPVQFVAGAATGDKARLPLVITEIMYNPPDTASLDGWGRDDFEFIELLNTGTTSISLSGVRFTAGITFDFAGSDVTQLSPGQYVLVVKNRVAFECRYGTILDPRIAGEYKDKLSDSGERIRLADLQTGVLADFEYRDSWYTSTDGQGMSLVPVDPAHVTASQLGQKASWRASTRWGGSPGSADAP
jgi:hypothetical protein